MPETTVIRFPVVHAGTARPITTKGRGLLANGPGTVAFVDIADLDEARLMAVISANEVRALVDARRAPVFAKPRFRHREVVWRIHAQGIPYIEMAMLRIRPASERRDALFDHARAYSALEDGLARGLSLCLHDADARQQGWLEETRRLLRHSRGYAAELLPAALQGLRDEVGTVGR